MEGAHVIQELKDRCALAGDGEGLTETRRLGKRVKNRFADNRAASMW
jgi:hypothetical protein